jgi:hypothetical protein
MKRKMHAVLSYMFLLLRDSLSPLFFSLGRSFGRVFQLLVRFDLPDLFPRAWFFIVLRAITFLQTKKY